MKLTKKYKEELRDNLTVLLSWEFNGNEFRKIARFCTRMFLITKGIEYKMVKCDEENNPVKIVGGNKLIVDIYSKDYKFHRIII